MNPYRFRIGQSTIRVITIMVKTTIIRLNGIKKKKPETLTTQQNNPQNKREPTGTVNQPANKTMRLNNIEENHFLDKSQE